MLSMCCFATHRARGRSSRQSTPAVHLGDQRGQAQPGVDGVASVELRGLEL